MRGVGLWSSLRFADLTGAWFGYKTQIGGLNRVDVSEGDFEFRGEPPEPGLPAYGSGSPHRRRRQSSGSTSSRRGEQTTPSEPGASGELVVPALAGVSTAAALPRLPRAALA